VSRAVALRIGLLVAILLAGLSYITFGVLQVRLGAQPFDVTARFPRAGGLFQGSYVAYRGVDVGRVSAIHLKPQGVDATLALNPGTKVPANTRAIVHDLSAVGEQYIDLVPTSSAGPDLRRGDVIDMRATQVPLTISDLLTNTSLFANSINTQQLSQLLQTLTTALGGTGPQLRTILQAGQSLTADLNAVKPQTDTLINSGNTLLHAAAQTNPDVAQISTNLDQLTAQLKASNADIQALITNGNTALPQLNTLLADNTQALQQLTTAGSAVLGVADNDNAAVQALLSSLPSTLGALTSVIRGGTVQATFFYNDEETVCTYTTNPPDFPEPTATSSSLTLGRSCPTKAPNLLQRGAAEVPEVHP
jgi:phospholipid/cholesterol/gamma-HCH transport system substrate-binding protein